MRPKSVIPFGQWAPDQSRLGGESAIIKGCLSIAGKYAPLPELVPIRDSAQINDDCIGGTTAYEASGAATSFLGDRSRLYRVVGRQPVDVSKAGGYAGSDDWAWSFCQFGDNLLAITRGVPLQRWILGSSGAFADSGGSPPTGDCVFRIRNHVMIGDGNVVYVSAFNNILDWTPNLATQAFSNELNQARGLIVSGWGGEQGVIFQERGMTRLNYIGGGVPFQFDDVEGGRGLCGPNAWTEWGRQAFCVAEDGFYVTDGLQVTPIGEGRVDREFATSLNYGYRHRVWAAIDAKRKSLMVGYPTGGSTRCDRVAIYSFADNRWTFDDLEASYGFEMHRAGVGIDDVDEITNLAGGINIDGDPLGSISVDSPLWRENRKEWAVVNGERKICQFSGPARAATFETGTFEPVVGRKTFVSEVWPTIDITDEAAVSVRVSTRLNRLGEAESWTPAAQMVSDGFAPVLTEGRYLKAEVTIAAGATWTEALGVQSDGSASGER